MLLNEVNRQQAQIAAQSAKLGELDEEIAELRKLKESMQAALAQLRAKDSPAAAR